MSHHRCLKTLLPLLLLASCTATAFGAPGLLGDSHGIYLGESQILDAKPARQLTLREDVRGYWFSPSGEKIAYVTYTEDHGECSFAVKIVDTWRHEPEIRTLVKQIAPAGFGDPANMALLSIVGWAGDDRYLLFRRVLIDASGADEQSGIEILDLTSAEPTAKPVPVEVKDTPTSIALLDYAWAPAGDCLLLAKTVFSQNVTPSRTDRSYFLYYPASARLQPLSVDPSDLVLGWLDDARLLMRRRIKGQPLAYRAFDLASGAESDTTQPGDWGRFPNRMLLVGEHEARDLVDPKDKTLSLDVASHRLPASGGSDSVPAATIWVKHSPDAKTLSVLPVGIVPGDGAPQAQWSPTGKAVAFVAHGDLFLTDLYKRPASPPEKMAAGEPLSCEETNQIASSNLKQIGLAMLQFVQDNDERFPPSAGFQKLISPYLKDTSVFSIGASRFAYYGDAKMTLARVDTPAALVVGQIETPCGHNILLCDGHVETFDDQGWVAWQKANPQQKF